MVAKLIFEFGFKVSIVVDSANVIICRYTCLKVAQFFDLEKEYNVVITM